MQVDTSQQEQWQFYDEQGRPLDIHMPRSEALSQGALHGTAHVWIWRMRHGLIEILVQKRAADKKTWPDAYDTSVGGHTDFGEAPLVTALRETEEEVGLHVEPDEVQFIGVYRMKLTDGLRGQVENELNWLYTLRVDEDTVFSPEKSEVASLIWKTLQDFAAEVRDTSECAYVPHGDTYYAIITEAIERFASVS